MGLVCLPSRHAAAALRAGAVAMILGALPAVGAPASAEVSEITVTATLREDDSLRALPASAAVLDSTQIRAAAVQHFEELAAQVPNLNWSGEGSRARYFQVRGAGELEQYEGAPNPSVGFLIDDIDVSGIGGVATRFDMARVEVLRGPQGTRYGANALAGLVYLQSAAPTAEPEVQAEASAGSDGTLGAGLAAGGPVAGTGDALAWRLAVHQFSADGFRNNAYLGRDDTGERDELSARGRLRWQPSPGWEVDFTAFLADLDNGYDAWSIDNSFTTQSDAPGRDEQRSRAGALRVRGPAGRAAQFVSITGVARSDILFSFDADWGNDGLWAPDVYAFTQRTDRERRTINQELRLVSTPEGRLGGRIDWLAGLYVLRLAEDNRIADRGLLDLDDGACPPPPDPDSAWCLPFAVQRTLDSDYEADSVALFAELSLPLGAATRITAGLRAERRDADYDDIAADEIAAVTQANAFSPTDRMWGGELALTHEFGAQLLGWARIARGYKAGGFNPGLARVDLTATDLNVSASQIEFGPEALWNYETGLRWSDARAWASGSVFWQARDRMQVRVPIQLTAGDPNTFVFLTDNAQSARALGLEAEAGWQATGALTLRAALGLLSTELERFAAEPFFEGRDFPHAPPWSVSASADWAGQGGWFARLDATGRGAFRFDYDRSSGPDRKADPALVLGLRAGRRFGPWEVAGWVRNLLDEDYAVRGFYFGNEPPGFLPKRYVRSGDPRQVGVTVSWRM